MDMMVISPNMDPKKKTYELVKKGDDYIIWKSGFGCTLKKVDYSPMPLYLDFSLKSPDEYKDYEFDDPNDKYRYHGTRQDIISGDGYTPMPSFSEDVEAAKGGGYMPASNHSVPKNVSAENYDYLIELIREYGKYPIDTSK